MYEAVDTGNSAARLFFADLSKGFDLIDHEILINELKFLDVHPVLVNWIQAFLSNRTQSVKIGSKISEWKAPKRRIPQCTKLGVLLFTIMTKNLFRSWHLLTKFVDDTTALEIIPRNGSSLLSCVANDIYSFSNDHGMRLNPMKCKEMTTNFMHNHSLIINPIAIGNNAIEGVTNYKLLGVILSSNRKWNSHIEYITKKANKRLFSLRILKRSGASPRSLVRVYLSIIRPLLEYAVPVWQNIPHVLALT